MPLVDIEITLKQREKLPIDLASILADELGSIFNSPPSTTWVKLYGLSKNHYAENHRSLKGGAYPVFVRIIKSESPEHTVLEQEVKKITRSVARICKRPPKNIHIIYEPEGSGRVSFGGKLVT